MITLGESTRPLVEWCEIFNVPLWRVVDKLSAGASAIEAILENSVSVTPVRPVHTKAPAIYPKIESLPTIPGATNRQCEIVAAIDGFMNANGIAPSVRDLMHMCGITSPNGIKSHLDLLRKKRLVDWTDGKARSLQLTDMSASFLRRHRRGISRRARLHVAQEVFRPAETGMGWSR